MKIRLDDVVDGEYRPRQRGAGPARFRDKLTEQDRQERRKKQKPWQKKQKKNR